MPKDVVGKVRKIPMHQYVLPQYDEVAHTANWTVECPYCGHLLWFSRDPRVHFTKATVNCQACAHGYRMKEQA